MAAPSPTAGLPSEASCPICLEYFRDPVSIHCGHNFCRACITRCWEWSTTNFSCPQCRETAPERNLRPSRELARVLEIAKRLSLQVARGETVEEEGCERHREPLKIFCKDDEAFICVICRESRAHRAHTMLPVQDAVQEYKGEIQARLQALKEDRDKLLGFREVEMRRNGEYLEKTEAERQRVFSKFEGLRLFLEDHACHLLAQLGGLERDIEKIQEENITSLTKEISCLDTLIQEMEEKCQQPTHPRLVFLSSFSRFEKENFQQPPLLLPELEKKISHFREKNIALEETLRTFQVKVTLDPSTAHPQLVVSADGRSVRWEDAQQNPPPEGSGTDPYLHAAMFFSLWLFAAARCQVRDGGELEFWVTKSHPWYLHKARELTVPAPRKVHKHRVGDLGPSLEAMGHPALLSAGSFHQRERHRGENHVFFLLIMIYSIKVSHINCLRTRKETVETQELLLPSAKVPHGWDPTLQPWA
uniref:Zinc finger protein RFP n=1 Tax=Strix occidentalis caurina TaxID=311401 RepID=A0A8D0EWP9_STROC